MDLDRAIRLGAPHPALRAAGRRGARFGRRGGGRTDPYSPAASAAMLPQTAIWIATTDYLGLADGNTTVDTWLAGWGGIRPTLTAPAATNRPAYTAGSPVATVTFDGVDNVLVGAMTKGSAFADYECGMAGQRVAFGTASDVHVGYYNGASIRFSIQDVSSAALRWSVVGGANLSSTTDPDGVNGHYSGDAAAGGEMNVRVAGVAEATTTGTVTSRADGGNVTVGGSTTGTTAANIIVRAAYMGPLLTADQRAYLRALLTALTGVSS